MSPDPIDLPAPLRHLAARVADPDAVAHFFSAQCTPEGEPREPFHTALADDAWRLRLAQGVGNSLYLTRILSRWPDFLSQLMAEPGFPTTEAMKTRAVADILAARTREEALRSLRLFKHREFLRIGLLDLTGEAELSTLTRAIAGVAEAALEAACRWIDRSLRERHGPPVLDEEAGGGEARFVVFGMGKLGGEELNFSSDVDLIFLVESDQGETRGARPLSIKAYYARLGQELMRLMQEPTPEGIVFRTDLRLRPEGESGELCVTRRAAEHYYEAWGQTWERAAMIKARPVAGDLALGEAFLAGLTPFVYRRYLDFPALEAIREMKRKIDRKVTQAEDYWRNVKLGYGGIREIEFFVQCHQLIHGGKNPALRTRGTLATLKELARAGLVDAARARTLAEGYDFLRRVEHRLQLVDDRQTHSLPDTPGELEKLAHSMGYDDHASFRAELDRHRNGVQAIYQDLFLANDSRRKASIAPEAETLLACQPDSPTCLARLTDLGFLHPEQAMARLGIFQEGPRGVSESHLRWFERLTPLLLSEILKAPDKDLALQHAESFLGALRHRTHSLAMLVERPWTVEILVALFGSSAFLSQFFNNHPDLLDHLWTREFLDTCKERGRLFTELNHAMEEARSQEERLDTLRRFKNTEVLRLGIRDLRHLADPQEVTASLCALADVILARVLADSWVEMEERHGLPRFREEGGELRRAEFAILAMGKLGGKELNYASDLDLIFVHGSRGGEEGSDGARPLANHVYFTRLAQKVIAAITTPTRAGKLYDLDTRLRPSGNAGPLVVSLDSFAKYQRQEAWTWEHQALTRARVAAGDPAISQALKAEILAILALPREVESLRRDIRDMRARLQREKAPPPGVLDIKQSPGGIVDIEFLVQYLLLAHGHAHPRILAPNLPSALVACQRAGLLTREEFDTLEESYRFLRLVENRLRLFHNRSENRIWPDPRVERQLARLCELPPEQGIRQAVEKRLAAVVPIRSCHLGDDSEQSRTVSGTE